MKMVRYAAAAGLILAASWPLAASAHSPVFDCHKEDASVVCEAGFSDGSSATGRKIRVLDVSNKVLLEGVIDAKGVFSFKPPVARYHVVFDGGEGHQVTMESEDIA